MQYLGGLTLLVFQVKVPTFTSGKKNGYLGNKITTRSPSCTCLYTSEASSTVHNIEMEALMGNG